MEFEVGQGRKVDALRLGSGNPSVAVKELGGTGRRHDWRISRQIREAVSVPVFLAGGLGPANVAEAVRERGIDSVAPPLAGASVALPALRAHTRMV